MRLIVAVVVGFLLSGCASQYDPVEQSHSDRIEIPAKEGLEWKVWMREGDTMEYQWTASHGVFTEFHGERAGFRHGEDYTSYDVRHDTGAKGDFTATFEGTHGWYWENEQPNPVRIDVTLDGVFDVVGIYA